jgi:hypothetical protein
MLPARYASQTHPLAAEATLEEHPFGVDHGVSIGLECDTGVSRSTDVP